VRSAVVVGGGLGGLAAAGLLSRAGPRVPLLEAAPYLVGGKRRRLTLAGKRIDTGPELLTFLGIWEEYLGCWDEPNEGRAEEIAGLNLLRLPEIGTYHYRDDVCSLSIDCIKSLRPALCFRVLLGSNGANELKTSVLDRGCAELRRTPFLGEVQLRRINLPHLHSGK